MLVKVFLNGQVVDVKHVRPEDMLAKMADLEETERLMATDHDMHMTVLVEHNNVTTVLGAWRQPGLAPN